MTKSKTVLVISDLQTPFHHVDSIDFLVEIRNTYKPTDVVCIGDEVDFHALSSYDPDPDGFSPGDEYAAALEALHPIYKEFPNVRVCTSNHTERPFRRAYSSGIPRAFMRTYREFLEAPETWEWKDHFVLDEVRYEHGHMLGGGQGKHLASLAPTKNGRSTVFGHFHSSAGSQWVSTPEQLLFGFNVGCLIDRHRYAFKYAFNLKNRPIIGTGVVVNRVPVFIPMQMDKHRRWTGRLL